MGKHTNTLKASNNIRDIFKVGRMAGDRQEGVGDPLSWGK